jgi:lipoprotein signal peptidase
VLGVLYRRGAAADYVDFIDLGIGDVRFWTFNMADVGITCGAIILAILLAREERRAAADAIFSDSPKEIP